MHFEPSEHWRMIRRDDIGGAPIPNQENETRET